MKQIKDFSKMIENFTEGEGNFGTSEIDLHLHTYYSDGTMSPTELVRRAAQRGVKTIAVTDHDGVAGVAEALVAGREADVFVIPGIEFSAGFSTEGLEIPGIDQSGKEVFAHILGYGIDIGEPRLNAEISRIRKMREKRNQDLLAVMNEIGYFLAPEDLLFRKGQDYVGKPNFAAALKKRGYIRELREAFAEDAFLRHPEARKVHREKIHASHAIDLIRNAGGEAVLAHPLKIGGFKGGTGYFDRLECLLDRLQDWGLTGMECRYSSHTLAQSQRLISIAQKRGLFPTGGSDFHGPEFNEALDIGILCCSAEPFRKE